MRPILSLLGLLLLVPASTTAGPITFANFTAAAVPGWISPLVPADVLTLDSAPFSFAGADGNWDLLAEQSPCGDNRIGGTTPASAAPPIVIFDGPDTPGMQSTLTTLAEAISFTYQVGDDGAIWTSAGADGYLHFTLLQVAAEEDTYYIGMTADCAGEIPGEVIGDGLPGVGEPRDGGSVPPAMRALQNYALIRITLRRSPPLPPSGTPPLPPWETPPLPPWETPPLPPWEAPPMPPSAASVPEPGTLGLIGAGVVAMWMRRRRLPFNSRPGPSR